MIRRVLVVEGERYVPLADVDALKRDIIAAARAGGRFVSFATASRLIELFVTDGSSIRIEELPDDD